MHHVSRRVATVVAATGLTLGAAVGLSTSSQAASATFTTPMSGAEEVPAVDTHARGVATFQLSNDGTELSYRVIASNIDDVHMAHIHLGAAGATGGVVVWLYPDAPPPVHIEGRHSGVLATGTITSDDLVGALAGMDLSDLVDAMEAGMTYVNVHTMENMSGEIRGQID